MKRSLVLFASVTFFLFACIISAYAVELTAEMVSKEGKVTRNGKICVKENKTRIEKGSTPIYVILRGDKGLFWEINGAERTYSETKLTPDMKPSIEEKLFGETARKQVGTETVNGYAARKYEISVKRKNKNETIYQWFSPEYSFPVKLSGMNWSVEYKNIKKGGIPDTIFELPGGMTKETSEVPDVLH